MNAKLGSVVRVGMMAAIGFVVLVLWQGVPLSEVTSQKPVAPAELSAAEVPRLVAALDGDALERLGALRDLAKIGPGANAAIPRLARELRDGNPSVRHLVVEAIAAAKPTAAQTQELLPLAWDAADLTGDSDGLARALDPEAATEYLARRLDDKDPKARERAVHLLGRIDARSGSARSALASLIADPQAEVAAKAAYGLDRCTEPRCLDALIKGLAAADARVRHACCVTLRYDGPAAARAAGALKHAMADPDADVAMLAAIAYAAVGGDLGVAGSALARAMRARRTQFIWQAADAVGRMGIDGPEVRAALEEATRVPDDQAPGLARSAREALEALARGKS